MESTKPASVEEYLSAIASDEHRQALLKIRSIIREEAPEATEVMSYGIPGFSIKGPFIWYAAFKKHCSLFAANNVKDFTEDLKDYKISKGTIQFTPEKPLPDELVRAIVRRRLADHLERKSMRKRAKSEG